MMVRNNAFRKINRWDVIVFYYCTGSNWEADPFLKRPDYQAFGHLSILYFKNYVLEKKIDWISDTLIDYYL